MLENRDLVDSLTKDMSKGVARIIGKKDILENINEQNLKLLNDKLDAYNPKSDIGRESKQHVLNLISMRIAEINGTPVNTASDIDAAKMVENKTCMLRIEVPQPGFNMCINTRSFVEKSKDPDAKLDLLLDDEDNKPGFDYGRHTVVQKLFGKEYLKPLVSQRIEFFGWLNRFTVKSSLLNRGCYLVPHDLINTVIQKIEELAVSRNALIDQFEAKYDEAIADAKEKLGVHFDPSRYPAFDTLRVKFDMFFRWQDVNPAAALKTINKQAYEQQAELGRMDWETTFSDIRDGLRAGFNDLIIGFADSMGNDDDGKPKVFHASKVEKLKEFLQTFEARDLTDDAELASLAATAKELISTVDPKILRKDLDMRANMATAFKDIVEKSSEMVVVRNRKVKVRD